MSIWDYLPWTGQDDNPARSGPVSAEPRPDNWVPEETGDDLSEGTALGRAGAQGLTLSAGDELNALVDSLTRDRDQNYNEAQDPAIRRAITAVDAGSPGQLLSALAEGAGNSISRSGNFWRNVADPRTYGLEYDVRRNQAREENAASREEHPYIYTAGEVAGGAPLALIPGPSQIAPLRAAGAAINASAPVRAAATLGRSMLPAGRVGTGIASAVGGAARAVPGAVADAFTFGGLQGIGSSEAGNVRDVLGEGIQGGVAASKFAAPIAALGGAASGALADRAARLRQSAALRDMQHAGIDNAQLMIPPDQVVDVGNQIRARSGGIFSSADDMASVGDDALREGGAGIRRSLREIADAADANPPQRTVRFEEPPQRQVQVRDIAAERAAAEARQAAQDAAFRDRMAGARTRAPGSRLRAITDEALESQNLSGTAPARPRAPAGGRQGPLPDMPPTQFQAEMADADAWEAARRAAQEAAPARPPTTAPTGLARRGTPENPWPTAVVEESGGLLPTNAEAAARIRRGVEETLDFSDPETRRAADRVMDIVNEYVENNGGPGGRIAPAELDRLRSHLDSKVRNWSRLRDPAVRQQAFQGGRRAAQAIMDELAEQASGPGGREAYQQARRASQIGSAIQEGAARRASRAAKTDPLLGGSQRTLGRSAADLLTMGRSQAIGSALLRGNAATREAVAAGLTSAPLRNFAAMQIGRQEAAQPFQASPELTEAALGQPQQAEPTQRSPSASPEQAAELDALFGDPGQGAPFEWTDKADDDQRRELDALFGGN